MWQSLVILLAFGDILIAAPAPLYKLENSDGQIRIPNEYSVKLAKSHSLDDHFNFLGQNFSATMTTGIWGDFDWIPRFHGYFIRINETFLNSHIRMDPGVELVDYNYALDYESLYANETAAPVSTNYKRRLAPSSSFSAKRKKWMKRANRAWNRIKEDLHWDVRMLLHYGKDPNVEKEPWDYAYMLDGAGWGVDVYVLDTGVRIEHELLNIHDTKAKRYKYKYVWEGEGDSWKEEGHGTAVAGLIKEVAPYCNIIDVKTIGLGGNSRTLAHAIYDITEDHIRLRDREPKLKDWYGSVINLSLAAGDVGALRHAVADAIKAGIPVVAAAGNKNHANCQYPGYYPDVLCVGAITREYTKASYSNYGDGVDVWAAGDRVNSASKNGDSQYSSSFRGSSFAAPQVSGIIASFIGYEQVSNDAKLYSKLLEQNWHPEALDFDNKRLAQTGIDHPKRGKDPYYRPEQTAMDTISQGPDKDSDGVEHPTRPDEPIPDDEPPDAEPFLPEYSIKHECNPAGEKSLDKATWVGFAEQFCNDNNGKTLVKRVDGKFDGAIENYYEKDDTKAHIYSFMDDDCYFPEIEEESKINAEECIYGIKWLFDQCDQGQDDKKFGGGINYRCQYYSLTPYKK